MHSRTRTFGAGVHRSNIRVKRWPNNYENSELYWKTQPLLKSFAYQAQSYWNTDLWSRGTNFWDTLYILVGCPCSMITLIFWKRNTKNTCLFWNKFNIRDCSTRFFFFDLPLALNRVRVTEGKITVVCGSRTSMIKRFWFELLEVDCTTLQCLISVKFSTYPPKLKANLLWVFLVLHIIRKPNSVIVILFVKIFPSQKHPHVYVKCPQNICQFLITFRIWSVLRLTEYSLKVSCHSSSGMLVSICVVL